AEALEQAMAVAGVELVCIIQGVPDTRRADESGGSGWPVASSHPHLIPQSGDSMRCPVPLRHLNNDCIRLVEGFSRESDGLLHLSAKTGKELAGLQLDFLLSFLPWRLADSSRRLARLGEWHLEIGEPGT